MCTCIIGSSALGIIYLVILAASIYTFVIGQPLIGGLLLAVLIAFGCITITIVTMYRCTQVPKVDSQIRI
jgi:hypothetical protein